MRSCIFLVYTMLGVAALPPPAQEVGRATSEQQSPPSAPSPALDDPDALYARREDLSSARRAAEIWAAIVTRDPANYEAAWKLGRVRFWLGDHAPEPHRQVEYELGMTASRLAIAARPDRAEGHFWLAANMGSLAELGGIIAGLKYRRPIRDEFETALKLDPAYDQGASYCALSQWYLDVPGLLGGSKTKSEELVRKGLSYNPDAADCLYFLAETLLAMDRKDEARAELRKVLEAPFDPDYTPEDQDWKRKAQRLLDTIK